MGDSTVQVEKRGGVAVVRMANSPVNAIDLEFGETLHGAIADVAAEPEVKAMVLIGQGATFSAGLNLKQIPSFDRAEQRAMVDLLNRLFGGLYGCPIPTVAAMNGHAIAGGMVLALACDYRVCARGAATLGLTEVRVGVPFPVGAIEVARGALSPAAARKLVQFGETVDPETALALGAIDEIADPDELEARALAAATDLTAIPAGTYHTVKQQLRRPGLAAIEAAITDQADPTLAAWLTDETKAAARAILGGS